ncbi:ABATE domain-containing protein [Burkholderia lata]|uniref:ABATE domain-containing protein n=1 Tax=Burkholderia lata (strain ATCC 17760 / DSM 23089 / LMG 22485 / NCIMB 9086 / R18194 / 383) TaxID=482957 RepID=UPI0020C6EE92|nr:ABATE domain-containing protein [Burkholderia lata]
MRVFWLQTWANSQCIPLVGEKRHDCLTDDASVVSWLKAAVGLPGDFDEMSAGLAELAGALRETVAQMVGVVKAGEPRDPVNQLLEAGRPVKGLVWDDHQAGFILIERRRDHAVPPVCSTQWPRLSQPFFQVVICGRFANVRRINARFSSVISPSRTVGVGAAWPSAAIG